MVALALAVVVALAFDVTNGFHDSSNAISALVVTRAGRPGPAVAMVGVLNLLGPLLAGTAVASTIGGIITVPADQMVAVVGAGLTAALTWNLLTWWRGLPSSPATHWSAAWWAPASWREGPVPSTGVGSTASAPWG